MPWWLAAIVFFFTGMAVDRFVIDRTFLRYVKQMHRTLAELRAIAERDED
jgi:hypothetical protein